MKNNTQKLYMVFSDETPHGAIMTAKQIKAIKGYKTVVEVGEEEAPMVMRELIAQKEAAAR